ncbi:MAG: branched-chain amino acid transport system substrate-binding protein [Baekduia sp.]|nr:branched-chain amino acid transport system substrate-binding protein [Baekduia sp.]
MQQHETPRRRLRGLIIPACASLALALTVASCGSSGDSGDSGSSTAAAGNAAAKSSGKPLKIGVAIATSGWMKPYDWGAYTTAQMAADDLNAKGGVNGRKIEFVVADMKSDPNLGPAAALKVIDSGAEVVLVSCDFDIGSPAALTAQSKGVVAMSLCAAAPKFGRTGIGPLAFSNGPGTPATAAAIARWAFENKKWKNVYMLKDTANEWSRTYMDYFEQTWKHFGGTIVGKDTFASQKDTSLASQITRIKALSTKPDFIVSATFPPGGPTMLRELRAAGVETPVVSDSGMDGTFWQKCCPKLSNFYLGTYASIYGDDTNPLVNDLLKRFEAKYKQKPLVSYFVSGYNAIEVLSKAIAKAGTTEGQKLATSMETFDEETQPLGRTTFSQKWHISLNRPWTVIAVQNGKPRFEARVAPTWVPQP